ncbi:MAG TPA: hypothetical protein VES00_21895 [Burkholderiaceae bacterium]|jgi:hypothetical protein|nr:hypothetical protein [Burkholderiaceae bacterium]
MKLRTHLLALAASATLAATALAAEQPAATSDSPETDASLYGQSVTLPRQAAVCAERIADYMPRFQKVFDAWRSENAARIDSGGKFIREQAAQGGVDADAGMSKLADADVERLHKTSLELLARHCQLMLDTLAPNAGN